MVGIDGPGGSGKSTLARALAAHIGAGIVEGDDFYLPSAQRRSRPADSLGPDLDWQRLRDQVLAPASEDRPVRYQRYDWDHDAMGGWVSLPGRSPLIVEGVYTLRPELRAYLDVMVWVDAPAEERLERGLARDGESARSQWVDEWMPSEVRYREETDPIRVAQLVVDGSGHLDHDPSEQVVVRVNLLRAPRCRD